MPMEKGPDGSQSNLSGRDSVSLQTCLLLCAYLGDVWVIVALLR